MKNANEIAEMIRDCAIEVADCVDIDPRDRNAYIGMLRNTACALRGAAGFAGFKQAAFAPTTSGSTKPGG